MPLSCHWIQSHWHTQPGKTGWVKEKGVSLSPTVHCILAGGGGVMQGKDSGASLSAAAIRVDPPQCQLVTVSSNWWGMEGKPPTHPTQLAGFRIRGAWSGIRPLLPPPTQLQFPVQWKSRATSHCILLGAAAWLFQQGEVWMKPLCSKGLPTNFLSWVIGGGGGEGGSQGHLPGRLHSPTPCWNNMAVDICHAGKCGWCWG